MCSTDCSKLPALQNIYIPHTPGYPYPLLGLVLICIPPRVSDTRNDLLCLSV